MKNNKTKWNTKADLLRYSWQTVVYSSEKSFLNKLKGFLKRG